MCRCIFSLCPSRALSLSLSVSSRTRGYVLKIDAKESMRLKRRRRRWRRRGKKGRKNNSCKLLWQKRPIVMAQGEEPVIGKNITHNMHTLAYSRRVQLMRERETFERGSGRGREREARYSSEKRWRERERERETSHKLALCAFYHRSLSLFSFDSIDPCMHFDLSWMLR